MHREFTTVIVTAMKTTSDTFLYLTYGLVALVAGTAGGQMIYVNRFAEGGCILFMAAGAIWVSATNALFVSKPTRE